jgi:MFS superfamily sulfate permease-like transporter
VAGLYVALGAMVMYALFGTSKQVVMGPEATTAILTAAAVAPLAGGDVARYAALAALTAILVGVLALLARVARLGFITDFLSKPILVGYILGVTLIVIGSQLGKMFGIKLEVTSSSAGGGAHQPPRRSTPAHRSPLASSAWRGCSSCAV